MIMLSFEMKNQRRRAATVTSEPRKTMHWQLLPLLAVARLLAGSPAPPRAPPSFERHRPLYHLTPDHGHNNDPSTLCQRA